jgi:hypothetical protein
VVIDEVHMYPARTVNRYGTSDCLLRLLSYLGRSTHNWYSMSGRLRLVLFTFTFVHE